MSYSAISQYLTFQSGLIEGVSSYFVTRKNNWTQEEWRLLIAKAAKSTTVYVGNLSFYTTEEQIFEHFSTAGMVKRVIMGLNKFTMAFAGFAFVEFFDHDSAVNARRYIHKTRLAGRIIKVDVDEGFEHGRMFGRGDDGFQVRDNIREGFDQDRGGYGQRMKKLQREYNLQDDDENDEAQAAPGAARVGLGAEEQKAATAQAAAAAAAAAATTTTTTPATTNAMTD